MWISFYCLRAYIPDIVVFLKNISLMDEQTQRPKTASTKLLGLKDQAETLEDWSEKSGISQSEIVRQLIQKQDESVPEFLKKKERKPSFYDKYKASRKDPAVNVYLREYRPLLSNYQENTGESISLFIRNLIAAAVKSSPELFEKR